MTRTFTGRLLLVLPATLALILLLNTAPVTSGITAGLPETQRSASPTPTPVPSSGQPIVSPDGSRIAFTSNRGGADDVFMISADGRNERRLTNTSESEGKFAWMAS